MRNKILFIIIRKIGTYNITLGIAVNNNDKYITCSKNCFDSAIFCESSEINCVMK